MRKLLAVVLALSLAPAVATASNLEAGVVQVSGGLDLSYSSTTTEAEGFEDQDDSVFTLQGDALFYAVRNLGIGLFVSFQDSSSEEGAITFDQQTTIIGPIAAYNLSIAPQASLFVGAGIGYAKLEVDTIDASGYAWLVRGGLRYFVVPAVSLDASIGYQMMSIEVSDTNTQVDSGGLAVGLGLSVYFGNR